MHQIIKSAPTSLLSSILKEHIWLNGTVVDYNKSNMGWRGVKIQPISTLIRQISPPQQAIVFIKKIKLLGGEYFIVKNCFIGNDLVSNLWMTSQ
jgi:hypothetical protein